MVFGLGSVCEMAFAPRLRLHNCHFGLPLSLAIATALTDAWPLFSSSSFAYSLVELLSIVGTHPMHDPELFFETGAMLFTFVSFGRFLEHIAKSKTSDALQDLMSLNVDSATLIVIGEGGETEKVIDIELVQRNDVLKVGGV